jgi:hypothetical protein
MAWVALLEVNEEDTRAKMGERITGEEFRHRPG